MLCAVQLGVGTTTGCEAIVHTVRAWLARNSAQSEKCLVALDLSNAFNAVDSSAVLAAARPWRPAWAPWADLCYRNSSYLRLGGKQLRSARGVQQGDPLGPALFSFAIHEHILAAKAEVDAQFPEELELCVFYLDDGVAGGTSRAVAAFCYEIKRRLAGIGLELTPSKCEVIPTCCPHQIRADLFPGFAWHSDGNFKLLGAAIGSQYFCNAHTLKRKVKAAELIGHVQDMEHSQASLLLLRSCASYCKLAYSARVVPPNLHSEALRQFSADLRNGLEVLAEVELTDQAWMQAQLSILNGGLGLRDAERHAPAAYVSSVWSCQSLCKRIDSGFDLHNDGGHFAAALAELKGKCLEAASLNLQEGVVKQKQLSALLDGALKEELRAGARAEGSRLAHLALVALPGAGAWLTAPPADDGRDIEPALFRVALQRRLRLRVAPDDVCCPCCGDVFDSFCDHALVCCCKGDRTVRHNAIRDVVHEEAVRAGTAAVKEKAGLLPARPAEDGIGQAECHRRPADIWLPRFQGASGEALDFACTSGMRADFLDRSASDGGSVFPAYEHLKRTFKMTEHECTQAGFKFTPMILESHGGGWSPLARGVLDKIAKSQSAAWNEGQEPSSLIIAQRISCSLQRENARAVLRRLSPPASHPATGGWGEPEVEGVV